MNMHTRAALPARQLKTDEDPRQRRMRMVLKGTLGIHYNSYWQETEIASGCDDLFELAMYTPRLFSATELPAICRALETHPAVLLGKQNIYGEKILPDSAVMPRINLYGDVIVGQRLQSICMGWNRAGTPAAVLCALLLEVVETQEHAQLIFEGRRELPRRGVQKLIRLVAEVNLQPPLTEEMLLRPTGWPTAFVVRSDLIVAPTEPVEVEQPPIEEGLEEHHEDELPAETGEQLARMPQDAWPAIQSPAWLIEEPLPLEGDTVTLPLACDEAALVEPMPAPAGTMAAISLPLTQKVLRRRSWWQRQQVPPPWVRPRMWRWSQRGLQAHR